MCQPRDQLARGDSRTMAELYSSCDISDAPLCTAADDVMSSSSLTVAQTTDESSKLPDAATSTCSAAKSLPTFKLVKVEAASGASLESVIQKYVDCSGGGGGADKNRSDSTQPQQQIIILKLTDVDDTATVNQKNTHTAPASSSSQEQPRSQDDHLWVTLVTPSSPSMSSVAALSEHAAGRRSLTSPLAGSLTSSSSPVSLDVVETLGSQQQQQPSFLIDESSLYLSTSDSAIDEFCVTDAELSTSFTCDDGASSVSSSTFSAAISSSSSSAGGGGGGGGTRRPRGPHASYTCDECGQQFTAKYRLMAHCKMHTGKTTYACHQCGDQFPVKNMLSNHLLQHAGELTCSVCGRVLSTKRSLQRHMAQHTGQKDYKCTHCRKEFFDRVQLVEHLRTHTGEKPFVCHVCGTAFARNTNLLAHMRIHRDEKPYRCLVCSREFRWRNNMVLHQKKHEHQQLRSSSSSSSSTGTFITTPPVNGGLGLCRPLSVSPVAPLLSDSALSNDSLDVSISGDHMVGDMLHEHGGLPVQSATSLVTNGGATTLSLDAVSSAADANTVVTFEDHWSLMCSRR